MYSRNIFPHPQSSSCTTTDHSSQKLSKLDDPDMWDTAGELRTNSQTIYSSRLLYMNGHMQDGPARIYIQQFGADTEYSLEELTRTMDNRNGCRERVWEIRGGSAT